MFHANITVAGHLHRPLVRSWEEGEKIASQMGGVLMSLTSSRKSRLTHKYAERLLDKMS